MIKICSVDECEKTTKNSSRGLCPMHYYRWYTHGDVNITLRPGMRLRGTPPPDCSVEGCSTPARLNTMCSKHNRRVKAHGDPNGGKKYVLRGSGTTDKDGYIKRTLGGKHQLEHRWIMAQAIGRPLLPGEQVHHRNGIRNDNQLENLELWVTHQPTGGRAIELLEWAKELIARYDELPLP